MCLLPPHFHSARSDGIGPRQSPVGGDPQKAYYWDSLASYDLLRVGQERGPEEADDRRRRPLQRYAARRLEEERPGAQPSQETDGTSRVDSRKPVSLDLSFCHD